MEIVLCFKGKSWRIFSKYLMSLAVSLSGLTDKTGKKDCLESRACGAVQALGAELLGADATNIENCH